MNCQPTHSIQQPHRTGGRGGSESAGDWFQAWIKSLLRRIIDCSSVFRVHEREEHIKQMLQTAQYDIVKRFLKFFEVIRRSEKISVVQNLSSPNSSA
jgi:hypothetical protein